MTPARTDLVQRLLDHCGLMCVTGEEGPIADAVESRYRDLGHPVERVGHSVVVGGPSGDRPLVVLVGHLDVVAPTDDDREPRVEDRPGGQVVVARGTSDMKAGNVVAMKLFEDAAGASYDLALLLYAGEEGSADGNELRSVLAQVPWLHDAALAVVLEPTDGQVQLGCLGGLHATLTVRGKQAHSARPWHGENALTRAGAFLAAFHGREPLVVDVDGIEYRDVWSFTQASTSTGKNVIPGELTLNLNFRFAPSRDAEAAAGELVRVVERVARDTGAAPIDVDIVDVSPPAPPRATDPIVASFVRTVGAEVAAKQAWTDVARFAEIGVPALNYGPGRTDQAHQRGEFVEVDAVVDVYERLGRFLSA
jgi:succinyl-diaminopimelate desuccinylase